VLGLRYRARGPGPIQSREEVTTLRKLTVVAGSALCMVFVATGAQAQAYGAPITLDQARKVYAAADAEARKNNWAMTVVIVDSGCNPS
jgi:hypothetical protein